jgi:flagellar capping protein FliD
LLRNILAENPEGVEAFFGSDTDGDKRVDSGMAYSLVNLLRTYVAPGKNIIQAKMDLEDNNIKMADERIERHEAHLRTYQEKLKRKFSAMEQSISGARAQSNWLNNQVKGMGGKEEDK